MRKGFKFSMVMLMICSVIFFGEKTSASAGEVMIIANSSVSAEHLGPDTIKDIFLGDVLKWGNNDRIIIVIADKSEIHEAFIKKYIKRTKTQFRNIWRQNMFTGKGMLPANARSIEDLADYVSKTPGAIGYITSDEKLPGNVKVLAK